MMIKGITVKLIELVETGRDRFNNPVYTENEVDVDNVLVAPASSDDIVDSTTLYGKKAIYTLAIPKGDQHVWEDQKVSFFGETWHVFGFATEGIEDNIPLCWNKKVMVERYG